MNNFKPILLRWMAVVMFASIIISCKKDDESEAAFTLSALTANDIDLNGATSPSDVPTDAVITATFGAEVDPAAATATNVKLIRDYDDAEIPVTVSGSGTTVTIDPTEELGTGTLYILQLGAGLASKGGQAFTATERNFTTAGTFSPAGALAHWTFEDTPEDIIGDFDPAEGGIIDVTYQPSRNENAGKAASFNGTTTLIEIPNGDQLMANKDFALSFWVNANSTKAGQFVMGLAGWYGFQFEIGGDWTSVKLAAQYDMGDGTTNAEDLWYNGSGETKDNGGWQGSTFNKDVTASGGVGETYFKDKWAHVVCMYNSTSKVGTMYINGEKVREFDFNLWPEGDKKKNTVGVKYAGNPAGNVLAFGFIQARENKTITDDWADYANPANNHFMGLLDDVRIFGKPLSETEIQLMYNSEKP